MTKEGFMNLLKVKGLHSNDQGQFHESVKGQRFTFNL